MERYHTALYDTSWYSMILRDTAQHYMVWRGSTWYATTRRDIVRRGTALGTARHVTEGR